MRRGDPFRLASLPNGQGRWRLYSRHRLPVRDDDLFHLDGQTVSCTSCAALDGVEFTTNLTPGSGALTSVCCTNCGFAETTDSRFHLLPRTEPVAPVSAAVPNGVRRCQFPPQEPVVRPDITTQHLRTAARLKGAYR